jgi:hypothetical protein
VNGGARVVLNHEDVLSNPVKGDAYGIQLAIDAGDDEVPALRGLADAIRSAGRGGA